MDKDPTWKKEWVEKALATIFAEAEARKLAAVGLPILVAKHGRLKHSLFIKLLGRVIRNAGLNHLKRLWIIAQVPENARLIELLKTELKH